MTRILPLLFLLLAALWPDKSIHAASSDWQGIDETQVRLISASSTLGDGKDLVFGLHFKMQENWKVYWRSPGDAGYPPDLKWAGHDARVTSEILWPKPERFEVLGLETMGYKDEVVYPLLINVENPSRDLNATAKLNFLTCADICVPVDVELNMSVLAGKTSFSDEAQLINRFKSQVPLKGENSGAEWLEAKVFTHENGKDGILRVTTKTDWSLGDVDAIAEGPVELVFQNPVFGPSSGQNIQTVDFSFDGIQFLETPLEQSSFIVTLMDENRSVELSGPFKITDQNLSQVQASVNSNQIPLIQILVFALIGGLILNIMPCVLPVLSIKVLGVVNQGGSNSSAIRYAFMASIAGIIFSFMALAALLIGLKSAGSAIGWGIQFQQPLFLIALALIIVFFACNLWGLFEVSLPSFLGKLGEVETGQKSPLLKNFFSGAFATLLATPCSAPFLGTAVGFALSRGTSEILLVFLFLGIGLALPYIILALNPKLISKLPKPGPWMQKVRFVLGFALLATAIWLLTVLFAQIGTLATAIIACLFVTIILFLAFKEKIGRKVVPICLSLVIASFIVPQTIANTNATSDPVADQHWEVFSVEKINSLVAEGKTVFVDVTADWCITCQVNKKVVLDQNPVREELISDHVVALRADWTSPNAEIASYLASFQRYGIPFNAVYGPSKPEGIMMPEILSGQMVLEALDAAK